MLTSDFALYDHGSIVFVEPLSAQAERWLMQNIDIDPRAQHWGNAVAIQPRYMRAVVNGILAEGYDVTGWSVAGRSAMDGGSAGMPSHSHAGERAGTTPSA